MSFTSSSSYKAHKTKLEMNEMERERKNEKKFTVSMLGARQDCIIFFTLYDSQPIRMILC